MWSISFGAVELLPLAGSSAWEADDFEAFAVRGKGRCTGNEGPLIGSEGLSTDSEGSLVGIEDPSTSSEDPSTGTEDPLTGSVGSLASSAGPFTGIESLMTGSESPLTGSEGSEGPLAGSDSLMTGSESPLTGSEGPFVSWEELESSLTDRTSDITNPFGRILLPLKPEWLQSISGPQVMVGITVFSMGDCSRISEPALSPVQTPVTGASSLAEGSTVSELMVLPLFVFSAGGSLLVLPLFMFSAKGSTASQASASEASTVPGGWNGSEGSVCSADSEPPEQVVSLVVSFSKAVIASPLVEP